MKLNSKILGVLLALLAVGVAVSAVSAVNLANDFNNNEFGIDVVSDTHFNESVNISSKGMDLVIFENSGSNSDDVNSIMYFKDSTADKNQISGFIKGLENSGSKVEETEKYIVLKNNQNVPDFDMGNTFDSIFNFVGSIFSSDGLSISDGGNSVSLSSNGLEVSDVNGQNVSITSDGVHVSGNESSNETVNVSSNISSNITNCDYSIYLKNPDNNKVIVLSGNNLELLKQMAETASFNEN
ncbi:hypothetical protein [Methanobrevibacter sp.]|uniref:hypothetical protein n=1 Tax=Methanobrevibacter sp. TaxID=66852 RepID=UPI0025E5BC06|nr:hypothetical protein [Methanobrevibacter sp.]MBQ6099963.1 hypothetical protein [Methanobrevibacter sp.]MBQ6512689.1 hypothetical protein [Methanobrevibacter sp.]